MSLCWTVFQISDMVGDERKVGESCLRLSLSELLNSRFDWRLKNIHAHLSP